MLIIKILINSLKNQFRVFSDPAVYVILILFFAGELLILRMLGFYPGPDFFVGSYMPPPVAQFKSLAILAVTNVNGFAPSRYGAAIAITLTFSVLFNSLLSSIFQVGYLSANNGIIQRKRISADNQFFKQAAINFLYILIVFMVSGSLYLGTVALSEALTSIKSVPVYAGTILTALSLLIILVLSYVPLSIALTIRSISLVKFIRILKKCWVKLLAFSSAFMFAVLISRTLLVNIICSPISFVPIIWLKWVMFFVLTFLLLLLCATQNFFGLLVSRDIIRTSFE